MNRSAEERFGDILTAIDRTLAYRDFLDSSELGSMAYDAVLRNLGVIGEAVRALPDAVKAEHPDVPWPSIAGLRNVIIHEYFRVNLELVTDIIDNELISLRQTIRKRHS